MRYSMAIAVLVALTLGSVITFRYQAAKAAHDEMLLAQADTAVIRAAEAAPQGGQQQGGQQLGGQQQGGNSAAPPLPAATPAAPVAIEPVVVENAPIANFQERPVAVDRGQRAVGRTNYFTVQQGWMPGVSAAPASPEAELASQDQLLEQEVGSLVHQLADAADAAQRDELKKKLIDSLEKQFDTQQKLRELEVAQIDARLQKLRELIRKRTESRRRIVDNRYEQLLNDAEGLGWSSSGSGGPGVGSPRFAPGRLPNLPIGPPPAAGTLPGIAPTPSVGR